MKIQGWYKYRRLEYVDSILQNKEQTHKDTMICSLRCKPSSRQHHRETFKVVHTKIKSTMNNQSLQSISSSDHNHFYKPTSLISLQL